MEITSPSLSHLPEMGFLRLADVLKLIPVSRTTWLDGVASGRYPSSVRISGNCVAYRIEDIRALIEKLGNPATRK